MIPSSIIKAFAGRYNPSAAVTEVEALRINIEHLVAELKSKEALLAMRVSIAKRELAEPQPAAVPQPPNPAAERVPSLPEQLRRSPALVAMDLAADGAIVWPAKPTRPWLSNVIAYMGAAPDSDKVELGRRLGVVIKARRLARCAPCRSGEPLDAGKLFFCRPMFDQLVAAAAKVRT